MEQLGGDDKVNASVTASLAGDRQLAINAINGTPLDGTPKPNPAAGTHAEHIERLTLDVVEGYAATRYAVSVIVDLLADLAAARGSTAEAEWQHFLEVRRRLS